MHYSIIDLFVHNPWSIQIDKRTHPNTWKTYYFDISFLNENYEIYTDIPCGNQYIKITTC